jgi:serine/threonine protein kinase
LAAERWKKAKNKTTAMQAFGAGVTVSTKKEKFAWIAKQCKVSSIKELELTKVIGAGLTGQVYLTRISGQGQFCAVKCVRKRRVGRECDVHRLLGEKMALQHCTEGAFTIKLFDTLQDKSCLYFVMEYAVGGELFNRLKAVDKLSNDVAKFYAAEILTAVEHVHSKGFVFRDLKPENVLLDEVGHIKLADFGFAKVPDENGRCYSCIGTVLYSLYTIHYTPCSLCYSCIGTTQYLAPEILEGKEKKDRSKRKGYTAAVDWWAWACMVFEFFKGSTPFWRNAADTKHQVS